MHILVTGATGFIGRHLVAALQRRGHAVRALGRNADAIVQLSIDGVETIRTDLRDDRTIIDACKDMDAVCHVGALSAPWGRADDFYAINVGGTKNVVAGCRKHGVGRLIYVSSPSVVFDGRDQRDQIENVPYPRPLTSIYSLTKKLGEDRVRAASQAGLATVTLRPKAVFGPGDTSLLPRLLDAARRGRLPQVGAGRNLVDVTYVDNVVHALLLALTADAALGKTYTITNGEHVLLWDLIKTVLSRLGLSRKLRVLSYPAAYFLGALMEVKATLLGGEPLLTRYTAAILAKTQTYNIDAARRDLGYAPVVSVAEGVERTLASLQESPIATGARLH